jgi:hypothetical protein
MVDSGHALSLLYHILSSPDPLAQCLAPKFSSEKTELRYHTLMQLGQLLRELRLLAGEWISRDRGSSFPTGTACHLAIRHSTHGSRAINRSGFVAL